MGSQRPLPPGNRSLIGTRGRIRPPPPTFACTAHESQFHGLRVEGSNPSGSATLTVTPSPAPTAAVTPRPTPQPLPRPADADGHQVTVEDGAGITVTVTSPDGSREKAYRVALSEAGPSWSTRVAGIEDLAACAKSPNVTALDAIDGKHGSRRFPVVRRSPSTNTLEEKGQHGSGQGS